MGVNRNKPRLPGTHLSKRPTSNGLQTYKLEDDGQTCRGLIDSMNEGALTLTREGAILYANQSFAKMVKRPLGRVMNGSFYCFLSTKDQRALRLRLSQPAKSAFKMKALLHVDADLQLPVKISARTPAKNASKRASLCLVVTDTTEAQSVLHLQRKVELLRNLVRHFTQTQEVERRRVTGQFHKNVAQLAYAILVRCGTLAKNLPARENASKAELMKLCDLSSQMIESIRRISRDLRPNALDDLGLIPVLRADCDEFGQRERIGLNLDGVRMIGRLPGEVEIALYRIFQTALLNVQQHAHARHVTVDLTRQGAFVQLAIKDDGIGFDPDKPPRGRNEKGGFGLAEMRERAVCVGGTLSVRSALRTGTEIEVRIPLPSAGMSSSQSIRAF
jgi:signal transduction histidine kinase